jgi:hypothetical protein
MRRSLPLVFAIILNMIGVAWIVSTGIALSGRFTYPLDDTYIHLSMADQVLRHGVWGVAGQSVSASSSPVWTLLLVLAGGLGLPLEPMPLVLNLVSSIVLLVAVDAALRNASVADWLRTVALTGIVVTVPLPWLTVIGMEHVLHAGLCVWFLLAVRRFDERRWRVTAIALAALLPLIRFESVFIIVAAILVLGRQWRREAITIGLASAASGVIFEAVAAVNGWMWLPNSVLVKTQGWTAFLNLVDVNAWGSWFLLGAMSATLLALAAMQLRWPVPSRFRREAAIVFIVVHLQLMLVGDVPRYGAYLYGLITVAYVSTVWDVARSRWRGPLTLRDASYAVVLGLPVLGFLTSVTATRAQFLDVPVAMRNIEDQQRQMARFAREFLSIPGAVVINDLGLVAYEGGRPIVDFAGIGDTEIARLKISGDLSASALDQIVSRRGAPVAMVYESWLGFPTGPAGAPSSWTPIGKWTIADNRICGDETVTVYATEAQFIETVRRDFSRFSRTLPARSVVTAF